MRHQGKDGFVLSSADVANDILIPRYYDPRIAEDLEALGSEFDLIELRELIRAGHVAHSHGDYVPKIFYGTGPYPYVRTSDLANCEVKASPKHGVPQFVYDEYAASQNVRPGDVLFVHEGTYLIGNVAMVTEFDGPMLYQHHVAKFSVRSSSPFNAYYLLAAFESPIVQRQIRAKQFSADIIDSVVGRLDEVVIPVPKDKVRLDAAQRRIENAILERAKLRERIAIASENTDLWLQGKEPRALSQLFTAAPEPATYRHPAFLGGRRGVSTTMLEARNVQNDVLLPRYYDPWVSETAPAFWARCDLRTVGDLVNDRILALQTGDEIGRLNYGTGAIPFVRTSDFGSWELKRESKQGVSEDVWKIWNTSQDAQADDILLVRDGTSGGNVRAHPRLRSSLSILRRYLSNTLT